MYRSFIWCVNRIYFVIIIIIIIKTMSEQFSANRLLAGKLWLDRNFPGTTEVDIAYLKARFNMPAHAEDFIKHNWHKNDNKKKPFANSEI